VQLRAVHNHHIGAVGQFDPGGHCPGPLFGRDETRAGILESRHPLQLPVHAAHLGLFDWSLWTSSGDLRVQANLPPADG